ncbi:MAG: hypothetical protein KDI56_14410 [Xanthomonadales bacterium]|nr:hypothetical protein [Xanthomonadales bacterium]
MIASFALAGPGSAQIIPLGCADQWRDEPRTQSFDYALDIQPIWGQYCANCHVAHGGSPAAGLDLDPAFSYGQLVNAPDHSLTILRVVPGDPEGSLLFRKLNCLEPGPASGDPPMPLGRPPLSASLQARIHDWIAAGAPLQLWRIYADDFETR